MFYADVGLLVPSLGNHLNRDLRWCNSDYLLKGYQACNAIQFDENSFFPIVLAHDILKEVTGTW